MWRFGRWWGNPRERSTCTRTWQAARVVGNRVTDLLREIQYKRQGRGTLYFEPLHIQYMSLRNEVVEIIHVQVAETIGRGGDLVKFGDGHTIVTLHFKKA